MTQHIVLDSSPLGLLSNPAASPDYLPSVSGAAIALQQGINSTFLK